MTNSRRSPFVNCRSSSLVAISAAMPLSGALARNLTRRRTQTVSPSMTLTTTQRAFIRVEYRSASSAALCPWPARPLADSGRLPHFGAPCLRPGHSRPREFRPRGVRLSPGRENQSAGGEGSLARASVIFRLSNYSVFTDGPNE